MFWQIGEKRWSGWRLAFLLLYSLLLHNAVFAATNVTVPAGSYVIDMGTNAAVKPNGLRPYGMIHELVKFYKVPIVWVVREGKAKDAVDYTIEGNQYKGGVFVIPRDFISAPVQTIINQWTGATSVTTVNGYTAGLVTAHALTNTYTFTGALVDTLHIVPRWTLDQAKGSLIVPFFTNAGIPASAYDYTLPGKLGICHDIFVLPHSDPTWATHGNLYKWNKDYKGSIWMGCHGGSALHNTYNPVNTSEQMNFLTEKVTTPGTGITLPVNGSTAYAQNSLVLWGNHSNGTLPFYTNVTPVPAPQTGNAVGADDFVSQFVGVPDLAMLSGSEQIYMPVLGGAWRSTTKIVTYDPTPPNVPVMFQPGRK